MSRMDPCMGTQRCVGGAARPREGLRALPPSSHSRGMSCGDPPCAAAGSPATARPAARAPRLPRARMGHPGGEHLGAVHELELQLLQSSRNARGGTRTSSWIVAKLSGTSLDVTVSMLTACVCVATAARSRGGDVNGRGGVGAGGAEANRTRCAARDIGSRGLETSAPFFHRRAVRGGLVRCKRVAAGRTGLYGLSYPAAPVKDILLEMVQEDWRMMRT